MTEMKDPKKIVQFLLAGKATFAVETPIADFAVPVRFLYRISKHILSEHRGRRSHCLWVKTAVAERANSYDAGSTYLGSMFIDSNFSDDLKRITFVPTPRLTPENKHIADFFPREIAVLKNMCAAILNPEQYPHTTFYHNGRCSRCNRVLTDPDSIERGIGQECFNKLNN